MTDARTYSTRELAQMWNVSESTVKRWADDFGLECYRTPGGHRRFRLRDICEFQKQRAFEATGMLTTREWEDPDLEVWLNSRNFLKVRELLLYLSSQNQRSKVTDLLERLYLRGMRLEEICDEILIPIESMIGAAIQAGEMISGQGIVSRLNCEEGLLRLSTRIVRRRQNGRTALCAAAARDARLGVCLASRLLEAEGWEVLSLGDRVAYETMSEMVETEPINLVCLVGGKGEPKPEKGAESLDQVSRNYRIPIVFVNLARDTRVTTRLQLESNCESFRAFRRQLARLVS